MHISTRLEVIPTLILSPYLIILTDLNFQADMTVSSIYYVASTHRVGGKEEL